MKKVLLSLLLFNLISNIYSFNPYNMMINKTDKWTTKINNVSNKEAYFAWLNNEWYNNNYNLIMEGDEYGKNSIRTKKNINQIITETEYPYKIKYKEYILPFLKPNKGEIQFKRKKNNSEIIWKVEYQSLPLLEEITYKMYNNMIDSSLKNIKTYCIRKQNQNI